MGAIDDLAPDDAARLVELVGRLKHDLGKYVALQQRWVGDDASPAERRSALEADLLSTRRGPDGSRDAAQVWADFARDLGSGDVPDITDDADVQRLHTEMATVRVVIDALRAGTVSDALLGAGSEAALAVSDACRRLARRVRRRAGG